MADLLQRNQALFAGGTLSEAQKDMFFEAVSKTYFMNKEHAREKFGRKKNKEERTSNADDMTAQKITLIAGTVAKSNQQSRCRLAQVLFIGHLIYYNMVWWGGSHLIRLLSADYLLSAIKVSLTMRLRDDI